MFLPGHVWISPVWDSCGDLRERSWLEPVLELKHLVMGCILTTFGQFLRMRDQFQEPIVLYETEIRSNNCNNLLVLTRTTCGSSSAVGFQKPLLSAVILSTGVLQVTKNALVAA